LFLKGVVVTFSIEAEMIWGWFCDLYWVWIYDYGRVPF